MSTLSPLERRELKISRFIDLDKNKRCFYNNIYLENFDIVIKMPFSQERFKASELYKQIIIERFDLTKYIYLINY